MQAPAFLNNLHKNLNNTYKMKRKFKNWGILLKTYFSFLWLDIAEWIATRLIKDDPTTWEGLRMASNAVYLNIRDYIRSKERIRLCTKSIISLTNDEMREVADNIDGYYQEFTDYLKQQKSIKDEVRN